MQFPNKEQVERVRRAYQVGVMVECVSIADPYTSISPGTIGQVADIDDSGTVFVKWRNGVTIGAVYGVDVIKRITPMSDKVLSQLLEVRATGRSNMLDTQTVQRIAFVSATHPSIHKEKPNGSVLKRQTIGVVI